MRKLAAGMMPRLNHMPLRVFHLEEPMVESKGRAPPVRSPAPTAGSPVPPVGSLGPVDTDVADATAGILSLGMLPTCCLLIA